MKKYISLFLLMLLLPYAAASLEVDDVRGYNNDERVTDINKDGGDFDVEQGDSIDLVVRIKNAANTTIQAKIVGTIKDIDDNADIVKTQDFFDIEANNDRSKTLTFSIPTDARRDEYDLELKATNSSGDSIKIVGYNVIVETQVSDDTSSSISSINKISDIVGNLTASCRLIADTTNTCFGYVETSKNCQNELSTVKEERGTYKTQSEECSQTKAELERQKVSLENDKSNMISLSQCNNQTATAVINTRNESDDKFNQTLLMLGGAALIYWYYNKRKKEKSSTASSYESDYFSKS